MHTLQTACAIFLIFSHLHVIFLVYCMKDKDDAKTMLAALRAIARSRGIAVPAEDDTTGVAKTRLHLILKMPCDLWLSCTADIEQ